MRNDNEDRTIRQTVKMLVNAENHNYALLRMTEVSNEFIIFLRDMLPDDYDLIAKKEENYQNFRKLLSEIQE